MVVGVAFGRSALDVVIVFLADVQLAADNRLDANFVGRVHKLHCAEDVAVVGHGDRWHAKLLHPVDKLIHATGAVEHGVVRMQM